MAYSYRDFKEPYTDDVEEVRNRNDMVEVVSQYVKLKKSGKRFKGLCPFHPEKRPSFMIDPQKQLFHCFGCEAGGDIYTFLMKIENIDFPEALQILADRAGYTLRRDKSGIPSGLAVQSSKYRRGCYDLFRDRLMFPIFDLTGKVIAFGGRTLKDETPKYINSPETMIYKKKKIVYAIDKAKEDIVKEDKVIVVEGYTDILALNQEGIRNCVASLGTALTIEQIRLLNRFTNNIITVFDADAAGEAATERSIDLLKEYNGNMELYREHNVNISAVALPLGYDPAKFIMEKKDENIINLINKAEPLIDFTLKLLLERSDSSTISGKLKAAYDLVNFISDIPSRLDQEEYIKAIAQKIDITEEQLFSYLSDVHRKKKVKPSVAKRRAYYPKEKVEIDETKITPQSSIELEAVSFIINSEGEPRELLLELEKNDFKYQPAREIFTLLKRGIINKKANKIYKLGNDLTSETSKKLFNKLQFEEKIYDNPHRISQEIYCRIKEFELKRRKK